MADAKRVELYLGVGGIAAPAVANFAINQTTDQLEFIFQVPEDMTITRLGFRHGTITGSSPVFIASLQGVTDGVPDGTVKGGGSPASVTFTPTGSNAFNWRTLANSYAAVRGEWLAAVVAYSSGTIDGSNNVTFTVTSTASYTPGTPYGIQNDAGSRTRQALTPLFGFGTAGTAYGSPASAVITAAFSSASTPDEKGVLLTIPAGWCSSYKVVAVKLWLTNAAAGAYDVTIYDTDGTTVLQRVSIDTDNDRSATVSVPRLVVFDETTLSTLTAGSAYRISFAPTTGTHALLGITVASSADLEAYPLGSGCIATSRADAGAWTDDATSRFGIWPVLADITAPAAGGGVQVPTAVYGAESLGVGA